MKTAEKPQKTEQGAASKNHAPKIENRPNLTGKEAKQDETVTHQTLAEASEAKAEKNTGNEAGNSVGADNQPADVEINTPKPEMNGLEATDEAPKQEIRYILPPRNVEATLKDVENLYRKGIQRMNLITRKKQLETFEVALAQEADELNDNPFQGCKLIIKDDKNREFVTTTPGLIRMVAQFIYDACDKKQAEIETSIVFPNA
jgi:hypothetical protein